MAAGHQLGTLVVVVLKARNLINKHFYKQDVFAQASLNGTNRKTQVDKKGGQHPLWDTELRFPIMKDVSNRFRKLELACYAKELRSDDLLGQGAVDITETLQTGEFDDWVKLRIDGVERGEVYLEMTYFSSGPPPKGSASSSLVPNQNLTRRPSKLPTSERLWCPPQTQHLSSSPPRKGHSVNSASAEWQAPHAVPKNAPLPSLPTNQLKETSDVSLPNILLPGGSNRPKQPTVLTTPPLAPGIEFVSVPQTPDFVHRPSLSPPLLPSNPTRPIPPYATSRFNNYVASSKPNPYLSQSTATATSIQMPKPQPDHVARYGVMPPAQDYYRPGETITGLPSPGYSQYIDPHPIEPPGMHETNRTARNGSPVSWSNSDLRDRYQKALPLPRESRPPLTTFNERPVPQLDAGRLHDLKTAEKEATQRKEQEQRDLELALRLDKELNT